MGNEAEHIFKPLQFADAGDKKNNNDKVLEKFDEYFVPKKNIIHERARFRERKQIPGQKTGAFIRTLYEMAVNCEFTNKDDQIRDQIVIGLKDKDASEKFQMKSTLTLDQATQTARQAEMVKTQIPDQSTQFRSVEEVKKYAKPKQSPQIKHFSDHTKQPHRNQGNKTKPHSTVYSM
jgi:hypothetical protein